LDFRIKPRKNPLIRNYSQGELNIAREFAKKVCKEFGVFIKAVVLFGSTAKHKHKTRGDIDVLVIINDLTITLSAEVVETYRVIMEKMISTTSVRIHLTTLKLTNFFDYVKRGDPIGINILRDGIALYDTGFFDPLQALLYQGRVRPTWESIWTYYARAPVTLKNSRWHLLQACIDLYWAVIDSAHAVLMVQGQIPPSPDHIADMLNKHLVKKRLLPAKYAKTMTEFYTLQKDIEHRRIKEISGPEYEHYYKKASDFVNHMKKLVKE